MSPATIINERKWLTRVYYSFVNVPKFWLPSVAPKAGGAPANCKGVIREEKYWQQKYRVMTTGDCMNKNIDPIFIEERQRIDHSMRSPYFTNSPANTQTKEEHEVHRNHLGHLLYRGVSQGGVTLSLTSHSSLSFHLAYSCHLSRPPHHPFCLPLLVTQPLFVVWPPLPASFVGIYIEISRET